MLTLTENNFAETVYTNNDKLFIVEFTAEWCSNCKDVQPILDELENECDDKIIFAKIDVDQNSELADRFQVDKLPTFILFKHRNIIDYMIGFNPIERFRERINEILQK